MERGRPRRLVTGDVGGLVAAAAANALAAASAAVSDTPPAEDVEMEVPYQPVLESFVNVFREEPPNATTVQKSIEWLKRRSTSELSALTECVTDSPIEPHEYICHPRKPLARLPLEGADDATFKYAMVDLTKTKHSNAGRKSKSSAKPDASAAASSSASASSPAASSSPTRKTNSSSLSQDILDLGLDFCNVTKMVAPPEAKMSLLFVQHPMRYPDIPAPFYFPAAPYIIPEQPVMLADSPVYCTGRPELLRAVGGGRSGQNILSTPHPMVPDPKYLVKPSSQCGEDCKVRDPDNHNRFYLFTRCVCVVFMLNENHEVVRQIGPANFRFIRPRTDRRRTSKKRPLQSSPSADSNTSHSSADSNPAASAPPPVLRWSSSSRVLSNLISDTDMLALDTPPADPRQPKRQRHQKRPATVYGEAVASILQRPLSPLDSQPSSTSNDELRDFTLRMPSLSDPSELSNQSVSDDYMALSTLAPETRAVVHAAAITAVRAAAADSTLSVDDYNLVVRFASDTSVDSDQDMSGCDADDEAVSLDSRPSQRRKDGESPWKKLKRMLPQLLEDHYLRIIEDNEPTLARWRAGIAQPEQKLPTDPSTADGDSDVEMI